MLHDTDNLSPLLSRRFAVDQLALLRRIGRAACELHSAAYLVGGPVRDLLLRRRQLDIDIVIEGDGLQFARALARSLQASCTIHRPFLTATVKLPDGRTIDIATARTEIYQQPGALPVVKPATIAEDLHRRDFTINAMAISLSPDRFGDLYDPFGGRRDLAARLLRILYDRSFLDDPTRILRGIGFQVRFELCFESATLHCLQQAVASGALATVSPHRLGEAFMALLADAKLAPDMLAAADKLGVLAALGISDTPLTQPRRRPLRSVRSAFLALGLPTAGESVALTCLALLAGTGPQAVSVIARALDLTARQVKCLANANQYLQAPPPELDDPAVPNSVLFFSLQEATIPTLAALWALAPPGWRRTNIERFWYQLRSVKADITGRDLLQAGAAPGPRLAAALRRALAHKLDHPRADRAAQLQAALQALED